jgi:hypothetical protein
MCPRLLYQGVRTIAGYFSRLRKLIAFRNIKPSNIYLQEIAEGLHTTLLDMLNTELPAKT